jgi:D-cysteine desulfhydrase family pyridoxal phosphate-dependent enzyme
MKPVPLGGEKMTGFTLQEFKARIERFPKQKLIHLPTPFRKLDRLSAELAGPDIYIKRDDLTGLAFGGNKSRKLELIIADALRKGADVVITWASLQSNWCLQTAAAARRFGLRPILLLFKTYDLAPEYDGNLLLDYIVGADIRIREAEKGKVVSEELAAGAIEEISNEVREWGHQPYVVSVGGSMPGFSMDLPLGAISYAAAFAELLEQAEAEDVSFTHVIVATGSGATQAGLAVAAKTLKDDVKIIGISVSEEKEAFARLVLKISEETEKALGLDARIKAEHIIVLDDYLKEGYGVVNREVAEAIRQVFTTEGIVLDPVYTGKAMAGLLDLVKKGRFSKKDKVVFFHTGGTPALFPYRKRLIELLA